VFLKFFDHNIVLIKSLMSSSLLPKSPPDVKGLLLQINPPLGDLNLNGHKNELVCLKFGQTVVSECTTSSTHSILYFPKLADTILLSLRGILYPLTLANPLL